MLMRTWIVLLAIVSLPPMAWGLDMLSQWTTELGGSLTFDYRWGELYHENRQDDELWLFVAAEPAHFVANDFSIGGIFGVRSILTDEAHGTLEVGPRVDWYFLSFPDGALFTEGSIRFLIESDRSDNEREIYSLGGGGLFPLNSRVALTVAAHRQWYDEPAWYQYRHTRWEIRAGFRFFRLKEDR